MTDQADKVLVKLTFSEEELKEWLCDYFSLDDTYAHWLTRSKEAYNVGTMTLGDFEEFDEHTTDDLAKFLWKKLATLDT